MKKSIVNLFALGFIVLIALSACNSGNKNKLIGIWKVTDVNTQFDETKVNPQTLQQVVELEKQTSLEFVDDSTLNIVMGTTTFKSFYSMDKTTGKIMYRFEDMKANANDLGIFKEDAITSETTTPVGTIKVTYKKEKK